MVIGTARLGTLTRIYGTRSASRAIPRERLLPAGPGDGLEIDVEPQDRTVRHFRAGPSAVDHQTLTDIDGALRQARERAGPAIS
jgi:hypothetical protein